MKKIFLTLISVTLLLPLFNKAYAEEKQTTVEASSEYVSKKEDQAISDYLSQSYLEAKMEVNDQIEAFKQKYRDYRQTEEYKKLLKEDPEIEKFTSYMSVVLNQLNSQVDQTYLVYLQPYQEKLAKIEQDFELNQLKLTDEVAKFVSDYSLTEPEKVKGKEYSQEELFTHWKNYAYYTQTIDLGKTMEELYQKHFKDLASLPADQQNYASNRDEIQKMFQEFIDQLEFAKQIKASDLAKIEEAETSLKEKLEQLSQVSVEEAVKNQQLFEKE
ncbi:hypothetical protein [Facklamia miroungae]|uniref:Uncharacterized protein n=1 Tax=Facklamia miroungae TaxID=120956 RepID=A0A1G7UX21_9LACT|nr:hypothetical protein [Facklamia miroungae]NKZ30156.1 hypothetical protein [Facklamia miroungae]SDG52014.1 hypothetical protein SAMN05421791_11243 [Facklamia miroungae]